MNDKYKDKWWNNRTVDQMKEANPHLSHLIGKNMDELHKMFPDAKICDSEDCEFNDLDHAIFMEYEQKNIDDAKSGKIQVCYRVNDALDNLKDEKIFKWYNGEKWVELKQ